MQQQREARRRFVQLKTQVEDMIEKEGLRNSQSDEGEA